jgi:hypothetical protein
MQIYTHGRDDMHIAASLMKVKFVFLFICLYFQFGYKNYINSRHIL